MSVYVGGVYPIRLCDVVEGHVTTQMGCGCVYVPERVVTVGALHGARPGEIDIHDGQTKIRVECEVWLTSATCVGLKLCQKECWEGDILRIVGTLHRRPACGNLVMKPIAIVKLAEDGEVERVCHMLEAVRAWIMLEQSRCSACTSPSIPDGATICGDVEYEERAEPDKEQRDYGKRDLVLLSPTQEWPCPSGRVDAWIGCECAFKG